MALFGVIKVPTVTTSAVVTRADGRVEDLGVIARTKGFKGFLAAMRFRKFLRQQQKGTIHG